MMKNNKDFQKRILIANRGEIAIRASHVLKNMGYKTVAIMASFEKKSLHVNYADNYIIIKGETIQDTYLNIDKIINTAKLNNCFAIYPGYGFLSENYEFARKCEEEGILFIGPSSKLIEKLGNKKIAKKEAEKLGIPVIKSFTINGYNLETLNTSDFPILIKASNGGGGRGMRIVKNKEDFLHELEMAQNESLKFFGSNEVYVESFIGNPRHIEVQVLGDHFGNTVHLFERECSVQRRFQKIIEEAPAYNLSEDLKLKLYNYATLLLQSLKYNNAGTVEFLVDADNNIYFLEVNTRIQVEYRVTELITGINIIKQQVKTALGEKLDICQDDITQSGVAIECRICAEDVNNSFSPYTGEISLLNYNDDPDVFFDTSYTDGYAVETYFDSMISKVIVQGSCRKDLLEKTAKFLKSCHIHGIKTNIVYLLNILKHKEFQKGNISTSFLQNSELLINNEMADIPFAVLATSIFLFKRNKLNDTDFVWNQKYWRQFYGFRFYFQKNNCSCFIIAGVNNKIEVKINNKSYNLKQIAVNLPEIIILFNNVVYNIYVSSDHKGKYFIGYNSTIEEITLIDEQEYDPVEISEINSSENGNIISPLHGKVTRILKSVNDYVNQGDILIVIESMKIENAIKAHKNGVIHKIDVKEGEQVSSNRVLMEIKQ